MYEIFLCVLPRHLFARFLIILAGESNGNER